MSAMRTFFQQRKQRQQSGATSNEAEVLREAFGEVFEPASSSLPSADLSTYHIAVQGCCHGELTRVYELCAQHERETGQLIDLLICCGDFQAVREAADLASMAVPEKYKVLGDFCEYYAPPHSGVAPRRTAPYLTLFVGGNHENSDLLAEESYGGFVAPNIYYVGHSGVVVVDGVLRVAGLSGIYKPGDYDCAYPPRPYAASEQAKRSAYHVRRIEVERLRAYAMLRQRDADAAAAARATARTCVSDGDKDGAPALVDVAISHDWPVGITKYGDEEQLLRYKPYFRDDIAHRALGNPHTLTLLRSLRPRYWFAAHLHCYFDACVEHAPVATTDGAAVSTTSAATRRDVCACTRFVALGKCCNRADSFLRFVDVPVSRTEATTQTTPPSSSRSDSVLGARRVRRDAQWLRVLAATHRHVASNRCGSPPQRCCAEDVMASVAVADKGACARQGHRGDEDDEGMAAATSAPTTRELLFALHLSPALPLHMTCTCVSVPCRSDTHAATTHTATSAQTASADAADAANTCASDTLEPLTWSEDV